MTILENWRTLAYGDGLDDKAREELWSNYFVVEKGIYEQILSAPETVVEGTVKELAEKYGTDVQTMTGFLDGINESLKGYENPIDIGTSRGEGIWLGGKLGRTLASGLRFEGQLRGGVYSAERSRTVELAQSLSRIKSDETIYALSGALRTGWLGTLGESDVEFFPHVLMTGTVLRTPTLTESGTGALSIRRSVLHSAAAGAGLTVNVPAPSQFSDYAWNWSVSLEWTRELTERAGNVTFGLAGATGETARSMDWPERNRLAGSVSLELLRKSGFSAALRLDGETMGSAHSAGAASAELRWTW